MILNANRNYWNKERSPKLESIIFRNDISMEKALDLCMNTEGEVDIVTHVPPQLASKVKSSKYAKVVNVPGNRVLAGTFNRYLEDVNFHDRKLRLAFNLAINRSEMIEKTFSGYATEVPALTPPWAFDFPNELKPIEYNPVAAQALLKETHYPKNRVLRIATIKPFETTVRFIAEQISHSLEIKVSVKVISPEEKVKWLRVIAEKRLVPNWDLFINNSAALFFEGTPAYFHRDLLGRDGAMRTGPVLPEFERLFNAMKQETNRELLLEKAKQIDRFVYGEALALFLCAPDSIYSVNKHVDFQPYRTSFELVDTSVSVEHWSRRK